MLLALWLPLILLGALALMSLSQFAADRPGKKWGLLRVVAGRTLKGGVARSLVLLAVLPGVALTLLLATKRLSDRESYERSIVNDTAQSAATQVDSFVGRHVAGIRSAAEAIELDARPTQERVGQWLLRYHPIYPDFLTMLVSDASGNILSASKRDTGEYFLADTATRHIRDRNYFLEPMSTGKDYVSSAFRGRGLGADAIVAISSPIELNGQFIGIVEGSLDLKAFQRLDSSYQKLLNSHVIIADQSNTVVYAHPSTGYRELERLTGRPLDSLRRNTTSSDSQRQSAGELDIGYATTEHGWYIYIVRPKTTLAQLMASVWWVALGWLVLCGMLAGVLAWKLAERVGAPLTSLTMALNNYQTGNRSPFRLLAGLPDEYKSIYRHLHGLVVRLSARHTALKRSLARAEELETELRVALLARESEVAARTRELALANEELVLLSRTDPLTKLANRRRFDEEFERICGAARREAQPVSVLMIDVDFFKEYNDRYGHQAGDRVLQEIAAALSASLHRPGDFAARYGGEEFAIVLGNTELAGAHQVAERIRSCVADLKIAHPGSTHSVVTVSIGLYATSLDESDDFQVILQRADQLLYLAKGAGRNRTCTSGLRGHARGNLRAC